MDLYGIREEFVSHRDNLIPKVVSGSYSDFIEVFSNSDDLNALQRYESVHEKFVYLTMYGVLVGESGLQKVSPLLFSQIEELLDTYHLDVDKLDPFSVALYYHSKAIYRGFRSLSTDLQNSSLVKNLDKSLHYYIKAKDDDRTLVVYHSLIGIYIDNGDSETANSLLMKFDDLRQHTDQLSTERKHLFSLRSSVCFLRINFLRSPNEYSNIKILLSRILVELGESNFSGNNNKALVESIFDLIQLGLDSGDIKIARLLFDKAHEIFEQQQNDLIEAGFPNPTQYNNEDWIIYFLDNIIKMYESPPSKAFEGYENLDELLNWGKISSLSVLYILSEQMKFLLKLYRGFGSLEILNDLTLKTEELLQRAISGNFELYKFKAILIKVRILMLQDKRQEGLDLLLDLKEEYTDGESRHLLNFLDRELQELTNIKLSSEYVARVNELNFQRYIRDSKLLLKEIQEDEV